MYTVCRKLLACQKGKKRKEIKKNKKYPAGSRFDPSTLTLQFTLVGALQYLKAIHAHVDALGGKYVIY